MSDNSQKISNFFYVSPLRSFRGKKNTGSKTNKKKTRANHIKTHVGWCYCGFSKMSLKQVGTSVAFEF